MCCVVINMAARSKSDFLVAAGKIFISVRKKVRWFFSPARYFLPVVGVDILPSHNLCMYAYSDSYLVVRMSCLFLQNSHLSILDTMRESNCTRPICHRILVCPFTLRFYSKSVNLLASSLRRSSLLFLISFLVSVPLTDCAANISILPIEASIFDGNVIASTP